MEDLVFFRDATRYICGSLDPSEVLKNCYHYLEKFIPLEAISMGIIDYENRSLRTIRFFSKESGISRDFWDREIALSPESWAFIEQHKDIIHLVRDAKENPPGRDVCKVIGLNELSFIVLTLDMNIRNNIGYSWKGVIALFATGLNKFTEEHSRLLELLHHPFAIALSNTLHHQELVRLKDLLKDDNRFLQNELHNTNDHIIIGERGGLKEVANTVKYVAPLNNIILLLGETGVGKDVIANVIHSTSTRSGEPFIKVNCGAIPENLVDSELFGHSKGSFTGAISDKRGRFERAHKGTIFLDEIGDLPLSTQIRMLRVIQFKELERVGGSETIKIDVRIIAATHRNLKDMVQAGKFREDLWFRLNVFPITIPPLRQRKEDIKDLVRYFINRKVREFNLKYTPVVSPYAMDRLHSYNWPGNVRELENAVERELIRSVIGLQRDTLLFEEFSGSDSESNYYEGKSVSDQTPSFDDYSRQHITRVLERTGGKINGKDGAAEILNINPSTLRNRMKKLGITFGRHR